MNALNNLKHELVALGSGAQAFATQILGNTDDAADVVQECFAVVLTQPSRFDPHKGSLKSWFMQMVRNRCIDVIRRRRPQTDAVDELPSAQIGPEPEAELSDRSATVRQVLTALTEEQRQILVLREYMDLSYAEIASVLGVAEGTVMSRLHRARQAFASNYETD